MSVTPAKLTLTEFGCDEVWMILGGYELGPEIGSGAMGSVHLAHQEQTRAPVALKRIHPKYAGQLQTLRRFNVEVQTAARLRHSNIVSVVASGTEPRGTPYCVMEWVSGRPLDVWARVGLPWVQISWMVGDLLNALAYAHARGVVHRDLKPANILVEHPHSDLPRVRLVDFGIARLLEDDSESGEATRLTMDDRVLGTPAYLSPEQATGQHHLVGPHTDLYAVGVILYELISGQLPFEGLPVMQLLMAHASTPAPRLDLAGRTDVPAQVAQTIARLLQKKPDERLQTARAVREALGLAEQLPRYPLPAVTSDRPQIEELYAPTVGGEEAFVTPVLLGPGGTSVNVTLQVQGSLENIDLVGRERELDLIVRAARQARRGRRSTLLLIQGEAGVGKSRLAQEARYVLEEKTDFRGARLLAHGGSEAPALRTLLARLLLAERLEGTALQTRLADAARRYELNTLDARALAAWLGEDETAPSEDEAERAELSARVLLRVATDRPLLVVLEGLDADSGGMIETFLRRLFAEGEEGLVYVLASSRAMPDALREAARHLFERLQEQGRAEVMRLGPLSDRVIADLIRPLMPAGATLIAERARGNPLFALELARYRAVETVGAATPHASLPVSIAEIWERRVQGTLRRAADAELARCVLFAAAILGPAVARERLVGLVTRALGRSLEATEQALDLWIRREVLADDGGREPIISFIHTLGFEYVAEHLRVDSSETQALAETVVDWVVETRAGLEPALLSALADLLDGAGDRARPAEARLLVGEILVGRLEYDRAQRIFRDLKQRAEDDGHEQLAMRVAAHLANLQLLRGDTEAAARALSPYRRRLSELSGAGLGASEARTLVGLLQAQASLAAVVGHHEEAVALLEQGVRLAKETGDELVGANVRTQLSQALEAAGEMADAERQCRIAIKLLTQVQAPDRMRARAYIALASLCRQQGRTAEAAEAADLAKPLAEAAGDRLQLDRALEMQVLLADDEGDLEEASRLGAKMLEQQRTFGDPIGIVRSNTLLGVLERHRGDLAAAARHFEEALGLVEHLGDRQLAASVHENLGVMARRAKQLEPALERFQRALELYEAVLDQAGVARVGSQMALVLRAQGRLDQAEGLAQSALALTREQRDYAGGGFAQLALGLVLAARGSWSQAREIFSEARSVLADLGIYREVVVAETWLTLAELQLGYGHQSTMVARRIEERLRERPVYKRVLVEGLVGLADALGGGDRELAWALEDRARRLEARLKGG